MENDKNKDKDSLSPLDEASFKEEPEVPSSELTENDSSDVALLGEGSAVLDSAADDASSEEQNRPEPERSSRSVSGMLKSFSRKQKAMAFAACFVVAAVVLFAVLFANHVICFHEWAEATCTHPSTCSICGKTQGDALGHEWQAATCVERKTCSRCGVGTGKELGHDVKEWSVAVEPSCTEKGKEVGECVRCGSSLEKSIPMIDHTPGDWVVVTEPSVGADGKAVAGLRSYSCTVCGEELGSEPIELSEEEIASHFKEGCSALTYEQVARDPDTYRGEKATFTGEVIQVMQEGDTYMLRVDVTPVSYGYKDTILVLYAAKEGEQRILEDDVITLYGTMGGMYTYETVMGSEVTVPLMTAQYVEY